MEIKKASFLLIVILGSLLSASVAGGHRKLMNKSTLQVEEVKKDHSQRKLSDSGEAFDVHPRILIVKVNDYGRYDPTPSFPRPNFKPIPN